VATNAEIRLKDGGFAGRLVDLFKASHSCCPPVLVGAPIQKGILQPQVGQVSMSHLLSQGPHSSSPRLAGTGVLEKNVYHYPSAFSTQLGLPWSRMQKRSHEETGKLCWNSFPQLLHEERELWGTHAQDRSHREMLKFRVPMQLRLYAH